MPWEKNGTPNTLKVAGDTLEITDLTATKTNQFISNVIVDSGLVSCAFTFNDNTNSVYASRNSTNGGGDITATGQTSSITTSATLDTAGEQGFNILHTVSVPGEEKLSMFSNLDTDSGTGAGNAPNRREAVFKFVPSPDANITSIECDNSQTGNYAIDTNISALGDIVAIPETIGGWVELGRTILGSAASAVDVTGLSDKRYYMILVETQTVGQVNNYLRVNGAATNYSRRREDNGGGSDPSTGNTVMNFFGTSPDALPQFVVGYLANVATKEKFSQIWATNQNTAGASAAPNRTISVGKHAQTTNPIDQISAVNLSVSLDTGSEVVVLGWDPTDVHTTNFWEELASVELSVAGTLSASFTAKKYLWVQAYLDTGQDSANEDHFFRLGSTTLDTGANYAYRRSHNGAADATSTLQTGMQAAISQATTGERTFVNLFIINNSTNEKLVTSNAIEISSSEATTIPARQEMVGKWTNTSNQADILGFRRGSDSNYDAGTILKIWGSD